MAGRSSTEVDDPFTFALLPEAAKEEGRERIGRGINELSLVRDLLLGPAPGMDDEREGTDEDRLWGEGRVVELVLVLSFVSVLVLVSTLGWLFIGVGATSVV